MAHYKIDDRYSTYRVEVNVSRRGEPPRFEEMDLSIDWDWLARRMALAAFHNKTRRTSTEAGAVVARLVRSRPKDVAPVPGDF